MNQKQFKQFENNIINNAITDVPYLNNSLSSKQIYDLENKIINHCTSQTKEQYDANPSCNVIELQYKGGSKAVHNLAHKLWNAGITDGIENDVGSWNDETIQTVIGDLDEIAQEKQENDKSYL